VPAGRLDGLTLIAGLTVTLYAREPVAPFPSVAVIVKLLVAALLGAPEIAPVNAFRASPTGSAPALTLNVKEPLPPVAVTVWLYAVPTVPEGRLDGFTVIAAFTVTL
jgi:hypothetical protein